MATAYLKSKLLVKTLEEKVVKEFNASRRRPKRRDVPTVDLGAPAIHCATLLNRFIPGSATVDVVDDRNILTADHL